MPPTTVFRGGALGDFIVTIPALRELAQRVGSLRYVGNALAATLVPELFESVESIDDPRWMGLFDDRVGCPAGGEAVVLLREDAAAGRLAAAGWHIAAAASPFPAEPHVHVAEHLLRAVGAGEAANRWRGAALVAAAGDRTSGRYAVVHPGSGSRRKNWPAERFASLVADLDREGLPTVVVAGPADEAIARHVLSLCPGSTTLAGGLDLPALAACLTGAAVYVGNDSGVSHLAGAVGVPAVVLFGPTRAVRWAPWGPRVVALEPTRRCERCRRAEQRPVDCACLEQIGVGEVGAAVDRLTQSVAA